MVQYQELLTRLGKLTQREQDIKRYLFSGCMSKVIAYELEISISTVEFHRRRVFEKTGTRNLAELVRLIVIKDQLATAIAQPPWA